jgi:flavin-dependent dehydrogenase
LFEEAARTPGVTAYVDARVEGPLVEHGRVTGLVVEGTERRATLVVGADGPHSRLRHALSLDVPTREKWVGMRAHFRLANGQRQTKWVDVFHRRGYELYVTPLPDEELLVAVLARTAAIRGRIEEQFRVWCAAEPELAQRLDGAEQVSELMAISPLSGRARRSILPGFVLLGDAAGFTDPLTGGGMTHALLSAELLAKYAAHQFGKRKGWLAQFDRERHALLRDFRILTAVMVMLTSHPRWMATALRGLRLSPALFSHLVGVSSGVRRLWGGEHAAHVHSAAAGYPSLSSFIEHRVDS